MGTRHTGKGKAQIYNPTVVGEGKGGRRDKAVGRVGKAWQNQPAVHVKVKAGTRHV